MDKDCIPQLVALGSQPASIQRIQDLAARQMERAGYGYTLHNACAATLSEFLNSAGINVPITLGAGRLAERLEGDRRWSRIDVGKQQAGDVAVTEDLTPPPGADHVFLVIARKDDDKMEVADNQAPDSHERYASGHGKTPTAYFLRAPGYEPSALLQRVKAEYPTGDEDSNALEEPFHDDGSPAG